MNPAETHEGAFYLYIGNIYYLNHLCVPKSSQITNQILREFHDTLFCGHLGFNKAYNKVKSSFFWPGMNNDICNYGCERLDCQKVKAEQRKMDGVMEPLDIPSQKWE